MFKRAWLPVLVCLAIPSLVLAQLIAPTEPLTPEQERAKLKVPNSLEVQLVAAEPDIYKPMNMKFDAAGRMWVTSSIEYPFPKLGDFKGRDRITVLSDFGPDGRARKIQQFADDLNIPIGLCPMPDGSCIVWSIPNIWRLYDTDGDGKADKREVLYSGFEYRDTHGDQNGFTYWVDGWVYACHGYNNHSKIKKGIDGPVALEMQSGNTYRFKPDGSAIEQVTWGQVNPFGMCFDPLGNLYTADCHTRPLTMLIRGAHYESFGKPHDGLGYGPEMINHDHGSTGLAGIAYYADDKFPAEFRDCLYVGNVITNRVHRDAIKWNGSTPTAVTKEDLIVSQDPWFRPVDVQLGPDGALYVADFYNRIIGHYELPLDHPQRDKDRGRIWRVVAKNAETKVEDFDSAKSGRLTELLGSENLTTRTLALNKLVEKEGVKLQALLLKEALGDGKALVPNVLKQGEKKESTPDSRRRAFAVWALARTGNLGGPTLAMLRNQSHSEPELQVHLLGALAEKAVWDGDDKAFVLRCLKPQDVAKLGPLETKFDRPEYVRRAAVEALGRHADAENIKPLLAAWEQAAHEDLRLIHTVKVALRNHLRNPDIAGSLAKLELNDAEKSRLGQAALAAPNESTAAFLFDYVRAAKLERDQLAPALAHVVRHLPVDRVDAVVQFVRERFGDDRVFQLSLLSAMQRSMQERGIAYSEATKSWARELVTDALKTSESNWASLPHPEKPTRESPWALQERPLAGGGVAVVISSHPINERLTGVLRSAKFAIPAKLSFWLCGHNGLPNTNPPPFNHLRIVLAETGQEIARQNPPRNDTAQKYTWDLAAYEGREGYIELVDGTTEPTFSWIGVAKFEPAVVSVPDVGPSEMSDRQVEALRLAGAFRLESLTSSAGQLLAHRGTELKVRAAAAEALLAVNRPAAISALTTMVSDPLEPQPVRAAAAEILGRTNAPEGRAALVAAISAAPDAMQQALGLALASSPEGGASLLELVTQGKASARLLQHPPIVQRLKASKIENVEARIAKLTEGLAPADERLNKLIAARRSAFPASKADASRGQQVFTKTCAACHQIAGAGARIGPSLDSIGNRGLERVLEDILDPNRNIDAANRYTVVTLKDGQSLAGLPLRTEGQTLILADATGKENRIAEGDITARTELKLSLMPAAIAEALPEQEFHDLVAYLLAQKAAEKK